MRRSLSGGLLLLLLLWLVAACSPTASDPTAAPSAPATTSDETVPDEPLPIPEDEFRSDPPSRVASTGRPQLIEFYADT